MKLIGSITIGVLLISAPIRILAQDAGPGYINIRVHTVKPDQLAQWASLIKERTDAVQEGGQPFFHVYQRTRGPLETFLIITPFGGIGEPARPVDDLPAVPAPAHWLNALRSTLVSESLSTLQVYAEANTNEGDSVHPGANFMHVRIRTVAAGRNQDYEEWLTNELIPALREAEVGDVRTLRQVLGGNPRNWITYSFVEGFPEPAFNLDGGMLARGDAMVVSQTDYFYTFREDLSFTAN